MKEAQQRNQEGNCQLFKEGKVNQITVVPQHGPLPQPPHTVCKIGQGVLSPAHATEIQQEKYIMHLVQGRNVQLRLRGGMPLRETHCELHPDVGGVQPPQQEEPRRLGGQGDTRADQARRQAKESGTGRGGTDRETQYLHVRAAAD